MRGRRVFAAAAMSAAAGPACAHSPLPGIEGFYAGLFHPLTTPDQLLALLGLGLLLGGFGGKRLARALGVLGLGLLAGLVLGRPSGDSAPWIYGCALIAAAGAALVPGRFLPVVLCMTLVAGGLLGWASLPDPGPPRDRLFTMSGSAVGAALATLYLAGGVDLLRERVAAPWLSVALRVVAAWVFAVAALMLALTLAPPAV